MYPSYEYVKAGGADHIRNVDSGVEIGAQGPSANPGEHTWTRLDPNADRSAAMIVERIRLPYYIWDQTHSPPPLPPRSEKGAASMHGRVWECCVTNFDRAKYRSGVLVRELTGQSILIVHLH